jgi:glycerol-3-phosphate dehydrogenase
MQARAAGPKTRSAAIDRLGAEKFDLLVIGGGITGAGIALDAATRGLSVALVEKNDFASGTSSKSSKLIHGGLRYLEHREFGLVHEATSERDRLRRIAPHLVTPVGFFWPHRFGGSRKAGVGLWIYDVMAAFRNVKRHDRIDGDRSLELAPALGRPMEGYLYYDSQTDDSRLVLAVIRAARKAGAVVCNHAEAIDVLDAGGRAAGAAVRDTIGGETFEVRAAGVVNATGVWADDVRLHESAEAEHKLRPSKGIHVVLSAKTLPLNAAVIFPTLDRKLIFAVPWLSSVIVGTTDTDYSGPVSSPSVTAEEVDNMLAALSKTFGRPFSPADLVGAYAGLRPLLSDPRWTTTRDLSRHHAIIEGPKGVITVTGGKLTTYRRMAEEVVDLVTKSRGQFVRGVTSSTKLGLTDLESARKRVAEKTAELDLDPEIATSLLRSYGDEARDVLDLCAGMELLDPIAEGLPYLLGEAVWAIRDEMAVSPSDLLERRVRVSLQDPLGGAANRNAITEIIKSETSRPATEIEAEFDSYLTALAAERGAGFVSTPLAS